MGIGGGIDALEVTVQHHLLLTFRGKGTMPVISHKRSRFLILSLPNEHKFLSNTLILLGFREYFLKFYPLLNMDNLQEMANLPAAILGKTDVPFYSSSQMLIQKIL